MSLVELSTCTKIREDKPDGNTMIHILKAYVESLNRHPKEFKQCKLFCLGLCLVEKIFIRNYGYTFEEHKPKNRLPKGHM